ASPLWLIATASRDLPLATGGWKALDVNLRAPRLVRDISDETSVGRKLRVGFDKLCLQERVGFVVPSQRQYPEIESALRCLLFEKEKFAVLPRKPVVGEG